LEIELLGALPESAGCRRFGKESQMSCSCVLFRVGFEGEPMSTRRDFLQNSGVIGVGLLVNELVGHCDLSTATSASADADSIVMMDGVSLSKAIHSKKVSCREVITAYLDHIARINPKVNAIVSLQDRDVLMKQAKARDTQLARGESMGWMHGFPHAVKDLEATKGIRTSYGSPLADGVPDHDGILWNA
jgi:amidase